MYLAKSTLVCAALVPTLALGGSHGGQDHGPNGLQTGATSDRASSVQLEVDAITITAEGLPVGCAINLRASNRGSRKVAISRDSQVKSWSPALLPGPWKKLGKSVWISPGQSVRWTYKLDFGCTALRKYRFLVKEFNSSNTLLNEQWIYYPSKKWTSLKSIDLGSLDRFF